MLGRVRQHMVTDRRKLVRRAAIQIGGLAGTAALLVGYGVATPGLE